MAQPVQRGRGQQPVGGEGLVPLVEVQVAGDDGGGLLVLDGIYRCDADGKLTFVEVGSPTDDEVHALLQTLIARLMKMLTRRGVLVQDMGQTWLAEPDADVEEACTLRPLQAAAITYRIAFDPRAGQKVLTLRGAMPREDRARQPLCADIDRFSLHAGVRVEAHDRKRLEQLCRYITDPFSWGAGPQRQAAPAGGAALEYELVCAEASL